MKNTPIKRYCLALDLINDPKSIDAYKEHHENVWPEIEESLKESGILNLEIYSIADRLFMIMETNATFSFQMKEEKDATNETVQKWEALMWNYQQALPSSKPGEKWMLMEKIYQL